MSESPPPDPEPSRLPLLLLGLVLIGLAAFPLLCFEGSLQCRPRGGRQPYPGWYLLGVYAPFFFAGISLVFAGLRWRVAGALAATGVALGFLLMVDSVLLYHGARACSPTSLGLRYALNGAWPSSCAWTGSLIGLCFDCLLGGLALESLRKGVLPESWRKAMRAPVSALVLTGLAPILLPLLLMLLPIAGTAMLRSWVERWRRD